jgi:drug/metabolite transporter (DMT)-like permease
MILDRRLLIALAPAVFVMLWSTGFVVARLTAGHVEPVSFLAFRFPLAGLALAALAFANGVAWPTSKDAFHAAVAGMFLHAGYLAPIYWAVAHGLPGGVSALIVGLQPLITAFLAGWILKDMIKPAHWFGLILGLLGVGLVLAPKFSLSSIGGITPVTAGLCVFGTFAVATGTIYQKRFLQHVPLLSSMAWQYVGASLAVIVVASATETFQFDGSYQAWFGLLWSVVVLSLAAIFLLLMLIRDGAVAKVSSLIFLVPGVSAAMTYLVFDEKLTPVQIMGMAVCAGAVMIVNRSGSKPA